MFLLQAHGICGASRIVDILTHDLEAIMSAPSQTYFKCTDGTIHINRATAEAHQVIVNNRGGNRE